MSWCYLTRHNVLLSAASNNTLRHCFYCPLTAHCNKSRDPVDRLEKLRLCRKLRHRNSVTAMKLIVIDGKHVPKP